MYHALPVNMPVRGRGYKKSSKLELPYPLLVVEEGLELHLLRSKDALEIFSVIDSNRDYLKNWLPWIDDIKTPLDENNFIQSTLKEYENGKGVNYSIKLNNQIIGNIGLNWMDYNNRSCGVGYWLSEEFTNNGIMTKCCIGLMKHCFDDLEFHRLVLEVAVNNLPSIAIANRLGMRLEGVTKDREWLYDHFVDANLYALIADEISIHEIKP